MENDKVTAGSDDTDELRKHMKRDLTKNEIKKSEITGRGNSATADLMVGTGTTGTGTYSDFIGIYTTFGSRMASFLNIDTAQSILIGIYGFPHMDPFKYHLKLSPDFTKGRINQVMFFSDLLSHQVRVGGQLTNLLDVLTTNSPGVINRQNAKTH